MMDIKYDFKANPFKEKDGKPVLYPAVVVKETITTDHIVKELSKHSAYSAGCVVGVLQEVADMVVSHLRQGKNVRLDGLGTFSLALSSREVTDRKEIRAASVRIKKVNFRPVPELVKRVRQETDILRAEFGFLPTVKKRSKEERWTLLEAYLKEHGSITRLAYSEWLGGLSDRPRSSDKVGNGRQLSFRKPVAITLGLPNGRRVFPDLLRTGFC